MKCTETKPETGTLSFKEIIGIIKSCGECGVSEMKFGMLELKFHPQAQSNEASQIRIIKRQVEPRTPRTALVSGEEMQVQTEEERQRELEEFEQSQNLISDPEAHEDEAIEAAIKGN